MVERVVKKVVNITMSEMDSNRDALIKLWCHRNGFRVPKKPKVKPVVVKILEPKKSKVKVDIKKSRTRIKVKLKKSKKIVNSICGCVGCGEELGQAIMYQDDFGLFFATGLDCEFEDMKHFLILMVDANGKVKVS